MRKFILIAVLALGTAFVCCQKQQTEEEKKAEVERQVQDRLSAEQQQRQAQELAQREADVRAREQVLKEKQEAEAAAPPQTVSEPQTAPVTEAAPESRNESSYSTFYTRLEPYGDWIETDDYGYVYRPREAENSRWRPYTNGRWVYTDAGWTWVSEEPFGWATYHYGRWTRIRNVGWVWVPGDEWAPAWVSWRKGGQYVGWAPLPPEAHFDRASGIRNWSDNYYDVGPDQYVFVPTSDLGEQRVERVIVPEQQNVSIVNQTTNVTNITYSKTVIVNQGPSFDEVRKQSRVPIQQLKLQRESILPAQNAHAVVRGDAVTIPAPAIAPARAPERPRAVKQTIKQAQVDRGWSAVSNQREAEQARAKMKTEATLPPNAPARKFVKPAAAPNATSAPPAESPPARSPQTEATTTPPSAATRPPSTPLPSRPATTPARETSSPVKKPPPRTMATVSASLSPQKNVQPRPSSPTAPFSSSPTQPSLETSATTTPASATPSVSPQATAPDAQRRGERKRHLPHRQRPGEESASPSPSPSPG